MTTLVMADRANQVRLGLRENAAQFSLLVIVNAFVGAMAGLERSILPAIAEQEFGLAARTAILSFIVVFGVSKALTNYGAGRWSDAIGRKRILVLGWLVAVPGAVSADVGAELDLDPRGECALGCQSRAHVVDDRDHED